MRIQWIGVDRALITGSELTALLDIRETVPQGPVSLFVSPLERTASGHWWRAEAKEAGTYTDIAEARLSWPDAVREVVA